METMVATRCIGLRGLPCDGRDGAQVRHENPLLVYSRDSVDVYQCLDCGALFCIDLFESAQIGVRYTTLNGSGLPLPEWMPSGD